MSDNKIGLLLLIGIPAGLYALAQLGIAFEEDDSRFFKLFFAYVTVFGLVVTIVSFAKHHVGGGILSAVCTCGFLLFFLNEFYDVLD